jgi:Ca-activated chloride channel family protein
VARPQATVRIPRATGTVVLAFDVSTSMTATDVAPSRLEAARAAAARFVRAQPGTVRVGVVAFDQGALTTHEPSADHDAAVAAIERLHAAGGTSLGQAVLASLSVIVGRQVKLPDPSATEPPADLGYWGSATIVLQWPWASVALLAFPLLLAWRWWLRRRLRRGAVRVSSVALIRAALPRRSGWRRRIPVWLLAAAMIVLGVGATRPQASVVVPSDASAILLALDVSGSMCSTDVAPNRLTAAQAAARDFIRAQHDGTRIGLVVFTGIAALRVPPTSDKGKLLAAIGDLRTAMGTAIGLGILTAIDAIAQINPEVAPTGVEVPDAAPGVDAGYEPDTIVVLTDGANTQGVDPVTAGRQAAARHLRIYTIGFGTTQPAPFVCSPDQVGSGGGFGGNQPGGGRGFGGGRGRSALDLDLDEATLIQVATITGGRYYQAKDAKALTSVLKNLPNEIVLQRRHTEITVWFALAGALLALAAVGLAQWWNRSADPR